MADLARGFTLYFVWCRRGPSGSVRCTSGRGRVELSRLFMLVTCTLPHHAASPRNIFVAGRAASAFPAEGLAQGPLAAPVIMDLGGVERVTPVPCVRPADRPELRRAKAHLGIFLGYPYPDSISALRVCQQNRTPLR